MKFFLLLLAGASLALGQATVLSDLTDDGDLVLDIGIIPSVDFEKAQAEITRLKGELAVAIHERENAVKALQQLKGKGAKPNADLGLAQGGNKSVEALRAKLAAARLTLQQQQQGLGAREQGIVARVNEMEQERAQITEGMKKKIKEMQVGFSKQEGEWERRLVMTEEERDAAVRKFEESELIRLRDHGAWTKAVKKWEVETQQAMRAAQLKSAQDAVANTARIAQGWKNEREELLGQIEAVEMVRQDENKAWEKAVQEWELKARQAMRTAGMKDAQDAVANTARLAADWQKERDELEAQVVDLTAQLAKLEEELGVKGPGGAQAEGLRLGLANKSKALEELGADASRLAAEWRKEREDAQRELAAMRDLYESSAGDLKTRDTRIEEIENKLAQRNQTLSLLTTEAEKLSVTWRKQRGGLQKRILHLQEGLEACQKELVKAQAKEEAAHKQRARFKDEKQKLLSQNQAQKNGKGQLSAKLAQQLALVAGFKEQLGQTKQQETQLKQGLVQLREEHAGLNGEIERYRVQKAEDAKTIATLQGELEQAQKHRAVAEKELAKAEKSFQGAQQKISGLQSAATQLEGDLKEARAELEVAREQANLGEEAKAAAQQKAQQVQHLEGQLARLSATQGELEGVLIATLGDFEKLQKAYTHLKEKSANGGEAALKAVAERQMAEAELLKMRERLKGEEQKVKQARERVDKVEAEKKEVEAAVKEEAQAAIEEATRTATILATKTATEAATQAGKAALGKSEAELQKARQELAELQLGHDRLAKEAQSLRERFVHIEPVRYQLASANVVAQQERVLAEVRQILEVYPEAQFAIKGHTCNLGSEDGNLKLSEERALVLKKFLLEKGIEESHLIETAGAGDQEPQASNETDEGRRQNRRVEIEVVK